MFFFIESAICPLSSHDQIHSLITYLPGADLGGGCRGCAPLPPEMTYGFLIQLVFSEKKCGLLASVTPFLRGAALLNKIVDPPLFTETFMQLFLSGNLCCVPGQDTILLHWLSLSGCINK